MTTNNGKGPTEPFNEAAYEMEVVFESEIDVQLNNEPEEEKLRGNTDPKLDPKYERNSGLTPMGSGPSLGASSSRSQGQEPIQPQANEPKLSDEEWQHKLRNGNHTFEEEFNGLRVRTWQANKPSNDGYEGGHLTELIVTKGEYGNETKLAHFKDGDWEKRPEATPERQAAMDAVEAYDGAFLEEQRNKEDREREQHREIEANRDKGHSR